MHFELIRSGDVSFIVTTDSSNIVWTIAELSSSGIYLAGRISNKIGLDVDHLGRIKIVNQDSSGGTRR